jgi:hypothetical protein
VWNSRKRAEQSRGESVQLFDSRGERDEKGRGGEREGGSPEGEGEGEREEVKFYSSYWPR